MTRIIKSFLLAAAFILLAFFTFHLTASAAIFSGTETVGGGTVGACIAEWEKEECKDSEICNSDPDSCHKGQYINCERAVFEADPRCITEAQIGTGLTGKALSSTGIVRDETFADLVIKYINFALPYITLAAFAGFVYAGFLYVTAYGNEEQLNKSKTILIWSVIGILLVMGSYAIIQFLTSGLLGQL